MRNLAKAIVLASELKRDELSVSEAVSVALNNLGMSEGYHIPVYLLLYSHWKDIID